MPRMSQILRKLATPGGTLPHPLASFPSGTVVVAQELLLSDALLDPHPVVIRTLDLGGDKMLRFGGAGRDLAMRAGLRGLAYSLDEKTMFRTQVRAILRAAQRGNVSMMFPMVMGVAHQAILARRRRGLSH